MASIVLYICKRIPQIVLAIFFVAVSFPCRAQDSAQEAHFTGSEACQGCHLSEYESFYAYAKKSRSYQSITKLEKGLSREEIEKCYSCHTTGYGKPGGFIDSETTPHLKNAGCEVCHGPGSLHVTTQNRDDIKGHLTKDDCNPCHISERIKAFRYKPLIHGGAH